MKYACVLLLFLITACHSSEKKTSRAALDVPKQPVNLLKPRAVDSLVMGNHPNFIAQPGDFISFKKYLNSLSDDDPASIPYALDYIKTCLPTDLAQRDSVVLLFNIKFYKISTKLSGELYKGYAGVVKKMEVDSNAAAVKNFKHNLNYCGIGIFMTEGDYYLDIMPDYLYMNFKNRVSPGVRQYLGIKRGELAQGFSEDAGLLISFDQLYQRVEHWEKFLTDYPNTVYNDEARGNYQTYLETLLTGMDNSRIFDEEKNALTPEVKTVYEKAMAEGKNSRSSAIITSYYNLLARHEFKDNDSLAIFLKANKLSTMLAVQPDTR